MSLPLNIIAKDSLTNWWDFDGVSGSTVYDKIGGINGTNNSVTLNTDGYTGKGATSVDRTYKYINLGTATLLMSTNNFSIATTINLTNWSLITHYIITSLGTDSKGYRITTGSSGDEGKLRFQMENGTTIITCLSDSAISKNNKWVHIVCTVDRTNSQVMFYVNGVKFGATKTFTLSGSISHTGETHLMGNITSGSTTNMVGTMDNLKIYNTVLTDKQVSLLYNQRAR